MKRLCFPLRGDHNLLTPETHSLSGVSLREQVTSEGRASLSGHLNELSTRWQSSASPTRRLRFEDETETEAESRYLERHHQRKGVGPPGTGVLVSKLDLNQCINIPLGHRGDQQQRGRTLMRAAHPIESGRVMFGGRAQLDLRLPQHANVNEVMGSGLYKPCLHVRTELLKESYIGCTTPADSSEGEGWDVSKQGRSNMTGINGNQLTTSQAPPTPKIPINPYPTYPLGSFPQPSTTQQHTHKCPCSETPLTVTSLMMSENGQLNNTMTGKDVNQNQEEQQNPSVTEHYREPQSRSELWKRRPCSSSAEDKALSTSGSSDGHLRHPVREELHSAASLPERFSRDGPSRLSLRRLFSSVKLKTTRTGSLNRLATKPHLPVPDHAHNDGRTSCSLLKKSPSAQSLCVGVIELQMKKSSLVQNFGSEKKSKSCCADNRPADEQFLPQCLSKEDISQPCSVRAVGQVVQVCSDGTVLLELSRPSDQRFGFSISRKKGRTDSVTLGSVGEA
ncbi:uncharacterized protein KIAA1614-like isoform X2 [Girardinichthys multiradiatus]|uniref:uncharacterized protein KIAA1614-like isoform X2 n=1 Tax=Girardinichthys multiradiatus TaxID=208333 RepID=UPI001FAE3C51|nr:uncharacterized protein KIAA1614-like isoform X2 [Girardinichthys multiradiatus]